MGRAENLFERLKTAGENAIDEFIVTRQNEELYLDFKRSADNGGGRKLHDTDRANFSKAISGFGNSEGGVLVWGIDASQDTDGTDVARAKVPIADPVRFSSWLENAVSGCTLPPHVGVRSAPIVIGSGNGFVATLIPRSNHAPHQSTRDHKYYLRAGSSFLPATHSFIAGLFGRRPQPSLVHNWGLIPPQRVELRPDAGGERLPPGMDVRLEILIANNGATIARDLFVNAKIVPPGPKCQRWFELRSDDWAEQRGVTGQWKSLVGNEGFRLAPDSIVCPMILRLVLVPPFEKELWFKLTYGCEGAAINVVELRQEAAVVASVYDAFLAARIEGQPEHASARRLFGLEREETVRLPGE